MGAIIYWALIRTAILIPILWISVDYLEYKFWWIVAITSIYGVIIHPAIIQYNLFIEKNREVLTDTICSRCRHFDESAVLCIKYDEHPKRDYVPCGGTDWEPK